MVDEQTGHTIGLLLVEALKDKLTKEHGKFSGRLQSSIQYKLIYDGEEVTNIEISMEDYAEYLEFGTPNPTTPEEILDWVKKKIMPGVKVTGKERIKQAEGIAKSLAAHITKYGPRPFPFIRETINNDLPGIMASVGL